MKGFLKTAVWILALVLAAELFFKAQYYSLIPKDLRPRSVLAEAAYVLTGGSFFIELNGQRILFRKPEQSFRVVTYSDPAPKHEEGGDRGTWPAYLRRLLSAYYSGDRHVAEVIHLAYPGRQAGSEIVADLAALDPDLVILTGNVNVGGKPSLLANAVKSSALMNFLYACYLSMTTDESTGVNAGEAVAGYAQRHHIRLLWLNLPGGESAPPAENLATFESTRALSLFPREFIYGENDNRLSSEAQHYLAASLLDWMLARNVIKRAYLTAAYPEFRKRLDQFSGVTASGTESIRKLYQKSIIDLQLII